MKKNSWKTLLSVVLMLTMLVSMLPFAAFAEDDQTANKQTEEAANTDDVGVPKVKENTGDAPKADDKPGAAKTDEKSGDAAKDAPKDAPKDDAAKEVPNGDTENPPTGGTEDTDAQIATLEAETEVEVQSDEQFTVTYKANYKADYTGGTVPEDIIDTVTIGETHTVRSSVTFHAPNGWLFVTWNTAADGSGTSIAPNTTLTENTTLYARWEPTPKTPYWAGLTISMSVAPANPKLNEPFTYTVTVTNGTGFDLTEVMVADTFPANVSAAPGTSDDWTFASSNDPSVKGVSFNGTLAAGSEASFTITAKFETGGVTTATNTARIVSAYYDNSGPVDPPTASATATLSGLDWSKLTINVSAPAAAKPGDTIEYTVTVKNDTGVDLDTVEVEYPLLSGLTYTGQTPSSGNWTFTSGENPNAAQATLKNLKATESANFTVTATVNDGVSGDIEIYAKILSAKSDSYFRSEPIFSNTVTMNIEPEPCVSISMSVSPDMANTRQYFTYIVTVTNNTNSNLRQVCVRDFRPDNAYCTTSPIKGTWRFDSSPSPMIANLNSVLPVGESASFKIDTYFYSNKTTVVNKAFILNATTVDYTSAPVSSNTVEATVYSLSALDISNDVDKGTSTPGDTLTYTVEVTNNTLIDLSEVHVDYTLNDDPSTGLTYVSCARVSGNMTFTPDQQSNTLAATITDLKVNESAIFTVTATVNAGVSGQIESLANVSSVKRGSSFSGGITKRAFAKTNVSPSTSVPVNVTVLFNGLKDVSQVPANYTLTGADSNPFLKGDIKLDPAESKTGHVFRTFTTTADVLLGQEYSLNFTQSGYNIPGYICTLTTETDPIKVTAQDAIAGINVEITLSYVKENLYTYPSVTVRTYFKGLAELPDNFGYKLTCTSAPEEATAFLTQSPLTLTKGTENGVPYMEFSTKNVTLQAGTELTFSFTQSGYDIPGYVCALGLSTFKFPLRVPATDELQPIQMNITNTYTQPDWSKLTITKAADKTRAMPGSVVKYTVTVTNNTGVDLSNIIVADKLDSDLRYSDSTGDYSTGTGTWTVASLANGKSVTLTLTVKLKYALAAGTVIENTATVTSAAAGSQTYDLSSLKISDSVSVTVTSGKGSPRTGDGSNLGLWIAVMAASLACAGAAAVIYKKRRG